MTDKATVLLKRFGRTFLFGGVAALLMALSATPSLATLGDLRVWLTTLVMAFITGGLSAIDKAYRWQD